MALLDPGLMGLEPFRRCLAALRAGRLEDADALASAIARDRPGAADVWHLLGVIATRRDRPAEAIAPLARALDLAPDTPAILFDLAIAEGRLGRHAAALASLDRVVVIAPGHGEAWLNRGFALRSLDRHAQALNSFDRALTLRPSLAEALHGRAHALAALGRPEEALRGYNAVLAADPDRVDALIGKGNALVGLDQAAEALACFDRALAVLSGGGTAEAQAHRFRGDTLRILGRLDDALAGLDQAVAIQPCDADAWCARGRVLLEMRAFEDALDSYDRAVALRPDDPKPHDFRSRALRDLGRYDDALAAAERAVRLGPDDAGALNSLGNSLRMLGRVEAAADAYQRAIAATPNPGPMRFNLGICRLLAGDYAQAWPDYEYRWTTERMARGKHRFQQPLWLGREPIAGRRILLHAEQGLGDTIQFCRYAPLVAAMGATVILGVQPDLRPLLSGLPDVEVIDRAAAPPIFEYHCPLLSLPLALGTTRETVPAGGPYLSVPPGHLAVWRDRLGPGGGKRIGIAWSGNRAHLADHHRSIPLDAFGPILSLGYPLHALQKDLRAEDVTAFALAGIIRFMGDALRDFADTAALVARMDLVITVDTAVAHLAGALGRPVWLLLPFAPDWRWGLRADTTPWYPTMRLFRQPAPLDWETVILRVRDALIAFMAGDGETPASGS